MIYHYLSGPHETNAPDQSIHWPNPEV